MFNFFNSLAEREGFEPSMQVLPACSLSRGVPSTSRPSLRSTERYYPLFGESSPSKPKVLCRARTANSIYFSSMTTEILISEVEII